MDVNAAAYANAWQLFHKRWTCNSSCCISSIKYNIATMANTHRIHHTHHDLIFAHPYIYHEQMNKWTCAMCIWFLQKFPLTFWLNINIIIIWYVCVCARRSSLDMNNWIALATSKRLFIIKWFAIAGLDNMCGKWNHHHNFAVILLYIAIEIVVYLSTCNRDFDNNNNNNTYICI